MTTYSDDFMRLNLELLGPQLVPCEAVGIEWPPPERLFLGKKEEGLRAATDEDDSTYVMVRANFSQITDEQRETMTHVARGAEYYYEKDLANEGQE